MEPKLNLTGSVLFRLGDATQTALSSDSVDAVVGSPPYLTRIDYAVATAFELAVLGISDAEFQALRFGQTGSILAKKTEVEENQPASVKNVLSRIAEHSSKASATYYTHTAREYFRHTLASVREICRVLKSGGSAALVVQDSYYKDVHLDLPHLLVDQAECAGMLVAAREDFVAQRTKATIHPHSRSWRSVHAVTESVVILRKP